MPSVIAALDIITPGEIVYISNRVEAIRVLDTLAGSLIGLQFAHF